MLLAWLPAALLAWLPAVLLLKVLLALQLPESPVPPHPRRAERRRRAVAAAASASVAPAALARGREEAAPGTAQVAPSVVGASGLLLALLPAALLAPKTSALRLRLPLVLLPPQCQ